MKKMLLVILYIGLLISCSNHTHSFDIYKEDEVGRWKECSCGEKDFYHEFTDEDIYLDIKEYQKNLPENAKDNYAYFGGEGQNDINLYIPNFSERYADSVEMQFGNVVYVGNDEDVISKMTENFIRISQSYYYADYIRNIDALIDMAYNFYSQGKQIQYDQNISHDRKIYTVTPEDATNSQEIYLDCSSFVNAVFYNTFGEPILKGFNMSDIKTLSMINFAANNSDSEEVIYYYEVTGRETTKEKNDIVNTISGILEPGDVYIYRHGEVNYSGGAGHAMLYLGEDLFMHSTGNSYNYGTNQEKFETSGSIRLDEGNKTVFNLSNRRSPFYKSADGTDDNTRIAILRPMNRENLKLTNDTISRNVVPGIRFEKKISCGNFSSVGINEDVTYSIDITNDSDYIINNVSILDNFASNVVYKSGTANYSGIVKENQILWNIPSIQSKSTITVKYTVTTNSLGLMSDYGFVGNLRTNLLKNTVSSIDGNEFSVLSDILKFKLSENNYENTLDFIYGTYDDFSVSIGKKFDCIDELANLTVSEIFQNLFDSNGFIENSKLASYVAPGLYGGLSVMSSEDGDCNRLLHAEYLNSGDIIFACKYEGNYEVYLYIGDILGYTDLVISINNYTIKKSQDQNTVKLLESLNGYHSFAVVRPTI